MVDVRSNVVIEQTLSNQPQKFPGARTGKAGRADRAHDRGPRVAGIRRGRFHGLVSSSINFSGKSKQPLLVGAEAPDVAHVTDPLNNSQIIA
jgi:hypothetical protein